MLIVIIQAIIGFHLQITRTWQRSLMCSNLDTRMLISPTLAFKNYSLAKPEKAMAPYSSTLAWITPWMEEPGGLPFMGSHRVGHD